MMERDWRTDLARKIPTIQQPPSNFRVLETNDLLLAENGRLVFLVRISQQLCVGFLEFLG